MKEILSVLKELMNSEDEIRMNGIKLSIMRYADDMVPTATTLAGLQNFFHKTAEINERYETCINSKNTERLVISKFSPELRIILRNGDSEMEEVM